MNNNVINLIFNADELSLDEYASKAGVILGFEGSETEDAIDDAIDFLDFTEEEKVRMSILKKLKGLAEKGVLPKTKGLMNFNNFISECENFDQEDYIDVWGEEGDLYDTYLIWTYKNEKTKEVDEFEVDIEKVNVISPLQESEVIIASDEVPEHYYIQYHDMPEPFLCGKGEDEFLKAFISLSMIDNDELFNLLLDKFEQGSVKDLPISTSLGIVYFLLISADMLRFDMHLSDESEKRYWDFRSPK